MAKLASLGSSLTFDITWKLVKQSRGQTRHARLIPHIHVHYVHTRLSPAQHSFFFSIVRFSSPRWGLQEERRVEQPRRSHATVVAQISSWRQQRIAGGENARAQTTTLDSTQPLVLIYSIIIKYKHKVYQAQEQLPVGLCIPQST